MAKHLELGEKGEHLASDYLKQCGYTIVATNWRKEKYEIDIIAIYHDLLIFIEVKTRSSDHYGKPEEFVTKRKQNNIISCAAYFIEEHNYNLDARFDVVSIIVNKDQSFTITHHIDAFSPLA